MPKTVLSERLVKSRAAYLQKSVAAISEETGLGNGYIYRLWNTDKMMLGTVNRIAEALDCTARELMEEVER